MTSEEITSDLREYVDWLYEHEKLAGLDHGVLLDIADRIDAKHERRLLEDRMSVQRRTVESYYEDSARWRKAAEEANARNQGLREHDSPSGHDVDEVVGKLDALVYALDRLDMFVDSLACEMTLGEYEDRRCEIVRTFAERIVGERHGAVGSSTPRLKPGGFRRCIHNQKGNDV